jgi:glycosyltransferase involved in cell wall biosynthesis
VKPRVTVLIPAYNEASAIADTVARARLALQASGSEGQVVVIDDGSTDGTAAAAAATGVEVLNHPTNGGYGRALKTGVRHAAEDWIAIMDADGSYPIEKLGELLLDIPSYDMVVGARQGLSYHGSLLKWQGRKALTALVHFVTGVAVPDVNSGMRVFRKSIALANLDRFSNGFSFTTTLTLAMFNQGHFIKYVPIPYAARIGQSKVRMARDTLRTMQILVMAILAYNPIKLFLALSGLAALVGLAGVIVVGATSGLGAAAFLATLVGFGLFMIFSLGLVCDLLRRPLNPPVRNDK